MIIKNKFLQVGSRPLAKAALTIRFRRGCYPLKISKHDFVTTVDPKGPLSGFGTLLFGGPRPLRGFPCHFPPKMALKTIKVNHWLDVSFQLLYPNQVFEIPGLNPFFKLRSLKILKYKSKISDDQFFRIYAKDNN